MAKIHPQTIINMTAVEELGPLAEPLAGTSNRLNDALRAIEKRLNALGLDVEVWLTEPLDRGPWRDVLEPETERPTGACEYDAWELGYADFGGDPALLVRTRRYVATYPGNANTDVEAFEDNRYPMRVFDAPRHLRVAAVGLIPRLVDALKAEADAVVTAVGEAEALAASLS